MLAIARVRYLGCPLVLAALLLGACAGKSAREGGAPNQAEDAGGAGGSSSGTGGTDASTGGSSPRPDCAKVKCAAISNTCKRIVQPPNECCPSCLDSGCDPCPELECDAGLHGETAAGDCCPSCVPDPLDACTEGLNAYAALRSALLEKYSSSGCKNSADCELLLEENACASACNIPLPKVSSTSFVENLQSLATDGCSSCPAPEPSSCGEQVAACVNGKCIGVESS